MSEEEFKTEKIILEAAEAEFIEKGYDGARMQEIAGRANINKALLHYYFRSKDLLFEKVFLGVFNHFFPKVSEVLNSDIGVDDKIRYFVNEYITLLQNNPHIPNFIISEFNRNSGKFPFILTQFKEIIQKNAIEKFRLSLEKEIAAGKIRNIEYRQLLGNIISMCIFPFVARPIFSTLLFGNRTEEYNNFLESRKTEVAEFVIQSISIKQ